MLLPMGNTALRGRLDQWFDRLNILPHIIGEFDDSTLLKVFARAGDGVFAASQVIEQEIQQQYDVRAIGRSNEVIERFYAISIERIIKHPAIVAISKATSHGLFTIAKQLSE
jgi:LysR family transcriptional activator of nhaA